MKATIQFFFLALVTWVGVFVAALAVTAAGALLIGFLRG